MEMLSNEADLERLLAGPLLHVLRALAVFWVLPVFGQGAGARFIKLGLAAVLGFSAAAARADIAAPALPQDVFSATLLVAREVLYGLLLGFSMGMVFEAVRLAGGLVASEMGLNMASQLDPLTRAQQSPVANLWQSMAFVLFFSAGGHKLVLAALLHSYEHVPPGSFVFTQSLAEGLMAFSSDMIAAAFRMAGPALLILMITTACIALLAKVAPALHMLEASYPIRLLAGFALMFMFLPDFAASFGVFLDHAGEHLMTLAGGAV
ncbi:MAG: type III secretion protein [Planctomycetes bacterium]|nr:type III secretion protein [Planctomycetota bacterium]